MGKKTKKNNLIAFWLAMASSLFLFISGTTGVASWVGIEKIILKYVNFQWINILFISLLIISSFGGIAVFIGGILVLKKKLFLGNLLISLGSGAGLISFIFNLLILIINFNFSIYYYLSFSSLGVILALSAQIFSGNKNKKRKWYRKLLKSS